ncbi:MAG: phosphatidate cytidylyltransferase [Christensenellales bacterium]|jgi:phosphatidate cytidylyltransferase
MLKRVVTSIIAAAAVVTALVAGTLVIRLLIAAVAVIACHEMFDSLTRAGLKPFRWPGFMFSALMLPALHWAGVGGLLMLLALCVVALMSRLVAKFDMELKDVFASAFVMLYPGLLLSMLMDMTYLPQPRGMAGILLVLCAAIFTDSFAYFIGVLFGKKKLCPKISPKKTIAGAIGGLFGGGAAAAVLSMLTPMLFGIKTSMPAFLAIGLICAVVSQFGDLAASCIKRMCGVKDFGKIMPGHGGIMDRLDSILFCAPIVYTVFILAGRFIFI